MVAGHFATALVAKRLAPRGHLAFYLLISQLPDLIWFVFHFAGIEPTVPANPMATSLDTMHAEMTYSHDVLPTLGWVVLAIGLGRAVSGSWRPGWAGGALIVVHGLCDALSGHPHFVFGPDSTQVGIGLYASAPYLALAVEALFTGAVMAWVLRRDAETGVSHSRTTLLIWVAVFGGGIAMLLPTADLSLVELTGLPAYDPLSGTLVPGLVALYASMVAALVWVDAKSTRPASGRHRATCQRGPSS